MQQIISSSILIIAIILIRRLFRKYTGQRMIYALWLIVAVKLLCPIQIENSFNVLQFIPQDKLEQLAEQMLAPSDTDSGLAESRDIAVNADTKVNANTKVNVDTNDNLQIKEDKSVSVTSQADKKSPVSWSMILITVWLAGAVMVFGCLMLSNLIFGRKIKKNRSFITTYESKLNVYETEMVESPCLFGVFRPVIYLPATLRANITERELNMVLVHEYTHFKHRDYIWAMVRCLCVSLYWFNPLVWLAAVLSKQDCEVACDESVLKAIGKENKKAYGHMLVELSASMSTNRNQYILVQEFGRGNKSMKKRLVYIGSKSKQLFSAVIAVGVLVTAVVGCTAGVAAADDNLADCEGKATSYNLYGDSTEENQQNAALQDLAYYLEKANSGIAYEDMSKEWMTDILSEYGNLLDDYELMGRTSKYGNSYYIVGQYIGDSTNNQLSKMYDFEYYNNKDYQIIYPEENDEAINIALDEKGVQGIKDLGYAIQNTEISRSVNSEFILIQPRGFEMQLTDIFGTYMNQARGREYIDDAINRGIALGAIAEPYVDIYMLSEKYGEISEKIQLTQEEAEKIISEKTKQLADGEGFSASLTINGEDYYYSEKKVPQSLVDLAVEKCGYKFESPKNITSSIKEAYLACDWLDEPLYLDKANYSRLEDMLKSAKMDGVGDCGYNAKLMLTLENGDKLVIYKGTDDCGSLVFGSFGGYSLSAKDDAAFWEMFGLKAQAPRDR